MNQTEIKPVALLEALAGVKIYGNYLIPENEIYINDKTFNEILKHIAPPNNNSGIANEQCVQADRASAAKMLNEALSLIALNWQVAECNRVYELVEKAHAALNSPAA